MFGFIFLAGSGGMTVVLVEVFISNFCEKCSNAMFMVEQETARIDTTRFDVLTVDVIEQIDHAVALGVLATPAIAIDGKLVFTGLPTPQTLRTELVKHIAVDDK